MKQTVTKTSPEAEYLLADLERIEGRKMTPEELRLAILQAEGLGEI